MSSTSTNVTDRPPSPLNYDVVIDRDLYSTDVLAGTALKAALEDGTLDSVYVKSGTYEISMTVTQTTNQTVQGDGHGDTVIKMVTAGTEITLGTDCVWRDVKFDGNSAAGTVGGGLVNLGVVNGRSVHNCSLINSATGGFKGSVTTLNTAMDQNSWGGLFGCEVADCTQFGYEGIRGLTHCVSNDNGISTAHHGFSECFYMQGCVSRNNAGAGFIQCAMLTNCGAQGNSDDGFDLCDFLTNCRARQNGFRGFFTCTILSSCEAIDNDDIGFQSSDVLTSCTSSGNGAGPGNGRGFNFCDNLAGCIALDASVSATEKIGFRSCLHLTACHANGTTGDGFEQCQRLSSCTSTGGGAFGYQLCAELSACHANTSTTDGFFDCDNLSGCEADFCGQDGFDQCEQLGGCRADSNTGDGFEDCRNLGGCFSGANSGVQYRDINQIAASEAGTGTATGGTITNKDPDSTDF